jgi:hypothetical protein
VAWKLESEGVSASLVTGRGNGGQWDSSTAGGVTVSTTPAVGDAAVIHHVYSGDPYGHVAYVEAVQVVSGSYQVKVSQYNWDQEGDYSLTGWEAASTYSDFVAFPGITVGGGSGEGSSQPHTQSEASLLFNGETQLFYYDASNGDLRYSWYDGTNWHFENLDGDVGSIAGQYGNYATGVGQSITAVDYGSGMQLFYTASDGALRHAWGNGTSWSFENLDGSSSSVSGNNNGPDGQSVASVVDSGGVLSVFYTAGNGDLVHAWSDSSGWHFNNLDGDSGSVAGAYGNYATGGVGTSVSAVASGTGLQVFYGTNSGYVRHAWGDGYSWSFENLDGSSSSVAGSGYLADVGSSISAAVDSSNTIQVFYTAGNGDLRHVFANSTGWHFENLDGDAGSLGGHTGPLGTSVHALVTASSLQVFYQNTANGDLIHAWADSTGWHFENLDGDAGSVAGQESADTPNVGANVTDLVDGSNILQMFYHSISNGDLIHAWADSTGWHFQNLDGDSGSIAGQAGSYGVDVG